MNAGGGTVIGGARKRRYPKLQGIHGSPCPLRQCLRPFNESQSGERWLRRDRAVFVVGDVCAAEDDAVKTTGGVGGAASDDAALRTAGGVIKAASDAGTGAAGGVFQPAADAGVLKAAGGVAAAPANAGVEAAGGVASTASDAGPLPAGGVALAASDAGPSTAGGVIKAASGAGPLITDDIKLPGNQPSKGRLVKLIPASDDQVVRPATVARIEGRGRRNGSHSGAFVIANDQVTEPSAIAIIVGGARAADDVDICTPEDDIWSYHANLRVGIDVDKRTKQKRMIGLDRC